MPVAALFKDPSNIEEKEVYYPKVGETIDDFLLREFPHNFNGIETDIYLNSSTTPIVSTESGDFSGVNHVIDHNDTIAIVMRPSGFDPITWLYIVVAAVAIAAALLLAPSVPGTADDQGSSPNNKLNGATNDYRPDQAIPEVFGSPRCYPDFIQPSWYEYEGNLKVQRELFCIGVGEYEVGDVRSSETLIDTIPNSSYTIYAPGVTPPLEQRLVVRETNEITDQSLEAPNSEALTGEFAGQGGMVYGGSLTTTIVNVGNENIVNLALEVGDYVDIEVYEAPVQNGSNTLIFSGLFEIVDITANTIELETGTSYAETPGYWVSGSLTLSDAEGGNAGWVGWYTVTGTNNQEIWFHFSCPQGVRTQDGGRLTIQFNMEIRQVDENGDPIPGGYTAAQSGEISESKLDPQYRTYKFTGLPAGIYQGRAIRTNDELGGAASEKIQLEQLVGVEYQSNPAYGNVTLLWLERKASERIVGGQQSKINCDVTRKLPYYNRETGVLEINNLVATRDFADAAAYTLIIAGKRSQDQVDLAELYAINDSLPASLRSFDFTFDDEDVALKERIDVICNVARTIAFQGYQKWRFNRIESKPIHTELFNRRNTVGSASQSIPQWLPSDKDSVSLTYVSLPANVKKTIHRRVAGGAIINDGVAGSYPKKITLTGCQSDEQAENRIDFEIRQLLYQRNTVEFTAPYFGLTSSLGDRVRWVDMNDQDVFDGEILYVIGNEFLTSEEIIFEPGKTYYVQITEEDGSISDLVECQPLDYTSKGFSAVGLGAYTGRELGTEFGSKYLIAPDDELIGTDYVLKSIRPDSNGQVTVTLSEYNEIIFEKDADYV